MLSDGDIEQLLAPVSAEAPAGDNLEYDAGFSELERAGAGKEERYSGGELIPAEEPEWRTVRELAVALFARTKDLRVAVQLAKAETALSGIAGLQAGMQLMRALLEQCWDEVHPKLEAEEDYDPVFRINALAAIDDPLGLLGLLRKTALVEARSVGSFTFRDLDVAEERATAAENATAPSLDLLKAALREAGSAEAGSRLGILQKVREDLRAVEAIFRSRASGGQSPDIEKLDTTLAHGIAFLETGVERAESGAGAGDADVMSSGPQAGAGGAGPGLGALRSREDVKRVLEQVCEYLEKVEPSNPAPLLIRRARRLLDRSFIDIIQDLAPDAFGQIEKLAGTEQGASQE
ncbi:MAG: type VI secretion system protein TssA [Betaproteobacteria bacterium]|nr:type VI secretion system protein TssA [Betaproteobacteria bacterium]